MVLHSQRFHDANCHPFINFNILLCMDKRAFNLPPLVLKARHLSGSAFCWVYLSRQWDGLPLGLGSVVKDGPTELSCEKVM